MEKYEKPELVEITELAEAEGDCVNGYAVINTCGGGGAVSSGCEAGGIPIIA